jgi:penicillin-binding protein 1C
MKVRSLALLGAVTLAVVTATALILDRVFPPDLSRAGEMSTLVVDKDERLLRAFTTADGKWRLAATPDEVDPRYLALLRAYEDRRFALHPGVDPLALMRAAWQALVNAEIVSGGSTLTMQTARLLEPRPRTLTSKLAEIARAVQIEARLSKDEILALYLSLAPYGGNIEGVRAASLAWLGKEPKRLTLGEAALLVVLPQSPERFRPDRDARAARAARDKVLRVLAARGAIPAREAQEAMQEPVPQRRLAMPFHAPHLAESLRAGSPAGTRIASTIDRALQEQLEQLARREAGYFDDGANLAIVVVENATRAVRAWVAGADFNAAAGQVDLVRARRSPGLGAEALPLRPRLRRGLAASRDEDRRCRDALRRFRAAQFRSRFPGRGQRARSTPALAQRARRRGARSPWAGALRAGADRFGCRTRIRPSRARSPQPAGDPRRRRHQPRRHDDALRGTRR